jgi:hypothetical protein
MVTGEATPTTIAGSEPDDRKCAAAQIPLAAIAFREASP